MIALTTIPVLLLTWIAVRNTRSSVEAQIVDANVARVRWAAQYLESVLERLDDLFYALQIDPDFIGVLDEMEAEDAESVPRELVRLLTNSYYSYSALVDSLSVYVHATGRSIELDNVTSGRVSYPDLDTSLWEGVLEYPIPLSIRRSGGELYALRTINRFMDRSFRGAMLVRIEDEFRKTVLEIMTSNGDSSVYLLNDSGDVLIASLEDGLPESVRALVDADVPSRRSPTIEHTGNIMVFTQTVRRGRLRVVKTVPAAIVTGSASATVAAGLLTGGALVAVSLIISIVFSLRISRPIVHLAESMREAAVPVFADMHGHDRDEIHLLQEGYEALIARLKLLVQKDYEHEIELKDARLLALQAQINPHFLNNTLNLLGGMAVAKGVPEIYRIARAVSDMFQYAAEVHRDLVTLNQELAHTRNYLLIQENRFAGRCAASVNVDMDVQGAWIPRFTLQPIVENAFEHGLTGKKGLWKVSIRAHHQRRGTIIIIEDNGCGMAADKLRELRSRLRDTTGDTEAGHSIGLRNVHTRLRIHFGDRFGLRVFSNPDRGTRVVVVLPGRGANREV